ncbi:inositol monophosphatase [Streptomyces sp. WAC05858]|uniref:inositol monophosphatase family protein n=1 Tax=Streptomyces TaxID=1883 RepID=UPI000F7B5788|nr:inositol monophosphatase [Streptomyces sp. WAC05858]RSS36429.1 inositol monophosphatase [Streptomyces sp. WAC05858]WTB03991.1 inositol monophosphatase [Streptomyces antimycoticus]
MRDFMESVTREAGTLLAEFFRNGQYLQQEKSDWDLVTEADIRSQDLITAAIRVRFPGHGILAEEAGLRDLPDEHLWLVDPLDGTLNFVRGQGTWGVSIAYAHRDEVRLGMFYTPETGQLYHAERGKGAYLNGRPLRTSSATRLSTSIIACSASHEPWQEDAQRIALALWPHARSLRMTGCGAGELCALAAGRVDGLVEVDGGPWDYAAGALIVREAGGATTAIDGSTHLPLSRSIVAAATTELHTRITKTLHTWSED